MEKVTKVEKQLRVNKVVDMLLNDQSYSEVVRAITGEWNISERHAQRYIADANSEIIIITEKNLEKRLAYHIQRRNKILRDLPEEVKKTAEGSRAQLAVLEDIAKLEQLYSLKIDLSIGGKADGPAIQTESTHRVIFEDYAAD